MNHNVIDKLKIRMMSVLFGLLLFTGCSAKQEKIDDAVVLSALLEQVEFEDTLTEVGKSACLYFTDLPEGTEVNLYMGSGYYADEVALLKVPDDISIEQAEKSVQDHLKQLYNQFVNYIPKETGKIENAVLWKNDSCYIICITKDEDGAREILKNAGRLSAEAGTVESSEMIGNAEEEEPATESTTEDNTISNTTSRNEWVSEEEFGGSESNLVESEPLGANGYPVLQSSKGEYYDYGNNVIRVDNSAFEVYTYVDESASKYAEAVNIVADELGGEVSIYNLLIPTAIGIVLPDDIAQSFSDYTHQGVAIENVYAKLSQNIIPVNCFDNLMKHRDEYLYFRTDFHWNGRAAYYAYEAFCNKKGIAAIPLSERRLQKFEGFLGALYWNGTNEDLILKQNTDVIEAYYPKSENAQMQFMDENGEMVQWDIICDVSQWKASAKYSTFAGADSAFAVFQNPDVTDDSVCVIVKESFGNALLPYLVDHYSLIYEIDYRYWDGNLIDFIKEKKADDVIFANNMSMIHSDYLIGKLRQIIE